MSPLRWDVLLVGFLLAVPVLLLGLRGDLAAEEMMTRVVWCLRGLDVGGRAAFRHHAPHARPPSPSPTADSRFRRRPRAADAQHSPAV